MRILMLSPYANVRSPLTKLTPILAEALRGLGCEIVSEPWGRHSDNESTGRKLITRALDVARVRRLLSEGRYDVLVVNTSHDRVSLLRDLPLVVFVRHRARRVVFQLHGGHSEWLLEPGKPLFKLASRLLFGLSDGILVLSSTQKRELERFAPSTTVHVVSNPYAPPANGDSTPVRNPIPTILFASRLLVKKGIYDLVEAAALLKDRLSFRLVIAGAGPEEAMLAARVRELSLEDRVSLLGYLPSDELSKLYRTADVFVLPTYDSEGFPTVIAEAMAAGIPIVATRNRGVIDHLAEGVNALFVDDRAPRELAEALGRVLTDRALHARMVASNRMGVRAFAPDRVAAEYLAMLRNLVATHETEEGAL